METALIYGGITWMLFIVFLLLGMSVAVSLILTVVAAVIGFGFLVWIAMDDQDDDHD